jgi:hypothetical protein
MATFVVTFEIGDKVRLDKLISVIRSTYKAVCPINAYSYALTSDQKAIDIVTFLKAQISATSLEIGHVKWFEARLTVLTR